MRSSHKIQKLADPRLLRSMRQHLGRLLQGRRPIFSLNETALLATIDRAQFQAIHDRHAVENPGEHWPKYLDLAKWLRINLRRAREIELDWGRPRQVLDLGSGAGYFLYVCKWLGHEPFGLDLDEVPMYGEMFQLLGLDRVTWRIQPFERLPTFPHAFDVITAFMICFNGHKSPALWGATEWSFLLDDLESHLKPGGRIRLGFNVEEDGSYFTPDLARWFRERGGEIENDRVTFRPDRRHARLR